MGRYDILTALAVFCVISLLLGTSRGLKEGEVCKTRLGIQGICSRIEDCSISNEENTKLILLQIKSNVCGLKEEKYLVCCLPKSLLPEEIIDVSQHPNIGLLRNDICGPVYHKRINDSLFPIYSEFPWAALLISRHGHDDMAPCAGSIINDRYILTSTSCVVQKTHNYVRLGVFFLELKSDCYPDEYNQTVCLQHTQDIPIEDIITYPKLENYIYNDIALVRLSQPANFSYDSVKPICLPIGLPYQTQRLTYAVVNVSSWRIGHRGPSNGIFNKVTIPVARRDRCLTKPPTINQICLVGDCCDGDLGAPITYIDEEKGSLKNFQYGIISSRGFHKYLTHTHVGYNMKWILDNMKP